MPGLPTLALNIDWCIMAMVTAAKLLKYRQMFELLQTHIRDLKKRKQTDWCSDETKETNPGGSKAANLQSHYTATLDLLQFGVAFL